jgi:hypothetical protein
MNAKTDFNILEDIFDTANQSFLAKNNNLFENGVSERTLCGALMLELYKCILLSKFKDYYVDVEYNRNAGSKLKTIKKTIMGLKEEIVTINCDLILHSRGENKSQDNLIAIEMKKSSRSKKEKDKDRTRLQCLTKDSYDNIWASDGRTLPEHICRYILGIYYEVDLGKKKILIEYYYKGNKTSEKTLYFKIKDSFLLKHRD